MKKYSLVVLMTVGILPIANLNGADAGGQARQLSEASVAATAHAQAGLSTLASSFSQLTDIGQTTRAQHNDAEERPRRMRDSSSENRQSQFDILMTALRRKKLTDADKKLTAENNGPHFNVDYGAHHVDFDPMDIEPSSPAGAVVSDRIAEHAIPTRDAMQSTSPATTRAISNELAPQLPRKFWAYPSLERAQEVAAKIAGDNPENVYEKLIQRLTHQDIATEFEECYKPVWISFAREAARKKRAKNEQFDPEKEYRTFILENFKSHWLVCLEKNYSPPTINPFGQMRSEQRGIFWEDQQAARAPSDAGTAPLPAIAAPTITSAPLQQPSGAGAASDTGKLRKLPPHLNDQLRKLDISQAEKDLIKRKYEYDVLGDKAFSKHIALLSGKHGYNKAKKH